MLHLRAAMGILTQLLTCSHHVVVLYVDGPASVLQYIHHIGQWYTSSSVSIWNMTVLLTFDLPCYGRPDVQMFLEKKEREEKEEREKRKRQLQHDINFKIFVRQCPDIILFFMLFFLF